MMMPIIQKSRRLNYIDDLIFVRNNIQLGKYINIVFFKNLGPVTQTQKN